jgi:hypothetical protein
MPHVKHASKRKRMKEALPVLGVVGMSLLLAGGASAGTGGPATDTPLWNPSHETTLYEEEVFDVSLGTFFVFDKENGGTLRLGEKFAQRGCRGCDEGIPLLRRRRPNRQTLPRTSRRQTVWRS